MGFRLVNVEGRAALADESSTFDLETLSDGAFTNCPMAAVSRFEELNDFDLGGVEPTGSLSSAQLGPPVPRPGKIFGIGLNYRAHAEETGTAIPTEPLVFAKFPNCISGPNDNVVLTGESCDYEGEVVVVIGKQAKNVPEDRAWEFVAGLTCGNDVSDRKVQLVGRPPQFSLGKSFDTYGPIGPAVVSPDLVPNRDALELRCAISGDERQSSSTDDLIFSVPNLVAYLSGITGLLPGDLIFTGTPSGVGMVEKKFLRPGDLIETSVEGIGVMRNRCV